MLAVILKILSILGILLLSVLGILLLVCLLVLFVPVSYRVRGHKNETETVLNIRLNWLFHLIRAFYDYPEPGIIKVKALFFTVYDSKKSSEKAAKKEKQADVVQSGQKTEGMAGEKGMPEETGRQKDTGKSIGKEQMDAGNEADKTKESAKEDGCQEEIFTKRSFLDCIFAKFKKLKYTIQILCDRIKEIRENISYYKRLWEREETKQLFRHAFKRIGKILKGIRPRRLKCSLVYGAASPDITGYIYGIYGIFCPYLGKGVDVVPDFTQAVLEGEIDAAGHITVFQILWNALMLLIDRRFWLLRRRLTAHNAAKARKKKAVSA